MRAEIPPELEKLLTHFERTGLGPQIRAVALSAISFGMSKAVSIAHEESKKLGLLYLAEAERIVQKASG